MKDEKLYVKRVSHARVQHKWNLKVPLIRNGTINDPIFIQCDDCGNIDWDKALPFTVDDLANRGNVQILN